MAGIPIPIQDRISRPETDKTGKPSKYAGTISDTWTKYFVAQDDTFNTAPTVVGTPVQLTGQTATVGATAFPTGSLAAGLYYVDYYAAITTAATTSSSLTVTFAWTSLSLTKSASGAAITGNTNTTIQSGRLMIRIDGASPVTYALTYASTGATAMVYAFDAVLSKVPL